ncbi:MAG TPA: globin domain-containing protein [Opitutaceae bacterium]|nr:globin domain-containing protein [Opitutaceae bacterium]
MNPLNPFQIALVESSFRKIHRHADEAAALFFTRLFEFDPVLRRTADGDMQQQKRFFVKLLGTVVHRLECFDLVRDYIREIATTHPHLSLRDEHHHTVGAAFFWMLEEILGAEFTPETYGAWMAIFRALSIETKQAVGDLESSTALAC